LVLQVDPLLRRGPRLPLQCLVDVGDLGHEAPTDEVILLVTKAVMEERRSPAASRPRALFRTVRVHAGRDRRRLEARLQVFGNCVERGVLATPGAKN